jgi:hypothetical protein
MPDFLHHFLAQEAPEERTSFGVTRRADPTTRTRKSHQKLVLTRLAHHPSETSIQVAAIEKGIHHRVEEPTPAAVRCLEPLFSSPSPPRRSPLQAGTAVMISDFEGDRQTGRTKTG